MTLPAKELETRKWRSRAIKAEAECARLRTEMQEHKRFWNRDVKEWRQRAEEAEKVLAHVPSDLLVWAQNADTPEKQ